MSLPLPERAAALKAYRLDHCLTAQVAERFNARLAESAKRFSDFMEVGAPPAPTPRVPLPVATQPEGRDLERFTP